MDRIDWISERLKIINKSGEMVSLWPNYGQLKLAKSIDLQRLRNIPVRIVLLKPRQVGWSTWSIADAFCDVYNKPNCNAIAVSADEDATDSVFRMAKLMHDQISPQRPTDYSNRKEIIYSHPHGSRFIAQTAGKKVLGRGSTFKRVHCSEVAFWRDAATQLGGLYQVVPKDSDTCIILESTANGIGGAFYDTFWSAVERMRRDRNDLDGFVPVFFPWFEFPEYAIKCPESAVFTSEERETQAKYNLTPEQLYWRKLKIRELNGDEDMFRQEYPSTAKEAFLTSGRPVFPLKWIDKQKTGPGRTCLFGRDTWNKPEIKDVERQVECWRIWKQPRHDHQYVMGVDTMEGRPSDINDPRSKLDYHGVVVFDRTFGEVVAQYHGRCTQHDLEEQCYIVGEYYNKAWTGIELPNGKTVLDGFLKKGYPRLYKKQVHDLRDTETDSEEYGWRTTTITRPWLVDGLLGCIRDNEIRIYSDEILGEMRTFTRDKTGKPIHLPGEHDDLLFALMIAVQMHMRCPLEPMSIPYAYTGQSAQKEPTSHIATMGAVDDFTDMFPDEEDACYTL
jgi:hypothetical protein